MFILQFLLTGIRRIGLRSRSYPAGRVLGGVFSIRNQALQLGKYRGCVLGRGLLLHAPNDIRSPKKDYANAYESVFLFRRPSES